MVKKDDIAVGTFIITGLGTIFLGIQALKAVAAKAHLESGTRLEPGEFACPNCGQPFSRQSFRSRIKQFPLTISGKHIVTCPRCWYTFEA